MSNRTIEETFRNSWHIGERYGRFKILIATEGGPDFSASQEANHAAFREHMQRNDIRRIIDIFDEAAKELELPLGEIGRADFYAVPLRHGLENFIGLDANYRMLALAWKFPCLLEFRQIARL